MTVQSANPQSIELDTLEAGGFSELIPRSILATKLSKILCEKISVSISKIIMTTNEKAAPEYYVLLCARRYAEVTRKLATATTDDERQFHRKKLYLFLEAGLLEHRCEYERRLRRYPDDFRKALVEKDGSIISRAISREEAELLRYASSIPPLGSIEQLSAEEMEGLADMFEGWAQSDLTDSVNVARLHGWADGLRSLAETVGANYIPPEFSRDAPISLFKYMAEKMNR